MEIGASAELQSVAKAGAIRLQANILKKQGLSNSQAKKAAGDAEVTDAIFAEARFALEAGLNEGEVVAFIAAEGTKEEKLKVYYKRRDYYLAATESRNAVIEHQKQETIRKSKRIQVDGLRGTDKQVAWALKIREKIVQKRGCVDKDFEALVAKIKSAKWWIENQNLQRKNQ